MSGEFLRAANKLEYTANEIEQQLKYMLEFATEQRGEAIGFPGLYEYREGYEFALVTALEMIQYIKEGT